jgi:hypothetical protein
LAKLAATMSSRPSPLKSATSTDLGRGGHLESGRDLELAVATAAEHGNGALRADARRDGEVLGPVGVEVRDRDVGRPVERKDVGGGLEGAVTVPELDAHAVADEVGDREILLAVGVEVADRDVLDGGGRGGWGDVRR